MGMAGDADRPDGRWDAMEQDRALAEEMDAIADRREASLTELGNLGQEWADEYTRIIDTSCSEPEADHRIELTRLKIQERVDGLKYEIARVDDEYKRVEIEYQRLRLSISDATFTRHSRSLTFCVSSLGARSLAKPRGPRHECIHLDSRPGEVT